MIKKGTSLTEKERDSFYQLAQKEFDYDWSLFDKDLRTGSIQQLAICSNETVLSSLFYYIESEHSRIQIGTVVTHPENRRRGYGAQLIKWIQQHYPSYTIYLYANREARSFYQALGFLEQPIFHQRLKKKKNGDLLFQRIEVTLFHQEQVRTIALANKQLFAYYQWILEFADCWYYQKELEVYALIERVGAVTYLYDILSQKTLSCNQILEALPGGKIVEWAGNPFEMGNSTEERGNDTLFVSAPTLPIYQPIGRRV